VASTLYDVLGVAANASPEALRSAYLERAREVHPDRWIDASGAEREVAERRMQDLTQAWSVLGDPARRRRYDLEIGSGDARARALRIDEARFATRSDGTVSEDFAPPDPVARLIRALPWIAVLLVLGTIFVFTAYAVTGTNTTAKRCVDVDGKQVACGTDGAKTVAVEVELSARCPVGTQPLVPQDYPKKLCLEG